MAAARTGIDAQLGIAKETVYGTRVVPSRFYEFLTESVKREIERIASAGLRSGKFNRNRSGMYASWDKGAAGSIEMEVVNKGQGLWLEHMLGKVTSSQPAVGTDPTVWQHKGEIDALSAKSFTLQIGRPDVGGTVRVFEYEGGQITGWEIGCSVGEIAKLSLECVFEEETTSQALASATYPSGLKPLAFVGGKLTIGGTDTFVKSASVKGKNSLATERFGLRSDGKRKQALDQGREIDGKVEAEFEDLTAYNRFVNGTEASLVLLFEGEIISTTYKFSLKVDCPVVRFDGETPNVGGADMLMQPLPFAVLDDAIAITLQTTDTTP